MDRTGSSILRSSTAAAWLLVLLAGRVDAATIIGLTTGNALIRFDASTPGTIAAGPTPITGLQGGEIILGIDYRPATGVLYGVSNLSRIVTINIATGVATVVGTLTVALSGEEFGVDFNPTADRLRIVSDAEQNLRVNADTAAVAAIDAPLAFANGDPHFGANPTVVASAYTQSYPGAATTQLYGIDSNLDVLVIQNPPNNGELTTVGGGLGVNTTSIAGFDIEPTLNAAYAALEIAGGSSAFYVINLTTGTASPVGAIGAALHVRGIAVIPFGSDVIGLTTSNTLIRFDSRAPETIKDGPITIVGLQPGESILGIDYRPSTAALYGVSSQSRLYTINATTGAATLVGTLSVALAGTNFGVNFNPTVDRIRVVNDADQNVRVNPDTAVVTPDTVLAFGAGDPHEGANPNVIGCAYTNSYPGAVSTTLYGIDSNVDALVLQSPANGGVLSTVGSGLGVNIASLVGFDIEPALNVGLAALDVGGTSSLYVINLTSGTAALAGSIGVAQHLRGLAVVLFGGSPPSNVVATANSSSQVTVTWSAVQGAASYEVYRRATGGAFAQVAASMGLTFIDGSLSAAASYLYKVRAVGPASTVSPESSIDLATTVIFTDDPLIGGGVVTIKGVHLTEIRTAINAVRLLAGLGAAPVTDANPVGVVIKAVHVTELRSALDAARAALSLPAVTYTNTLVIGATSVRANDFTELRNGTK